MTPQDFIVWFNGVADAVGDAAPSPAQWAMIKERAGEVTAALVAEKLLHMHQQQYQPRTDTELLKQLNRAAQAPQRLKTGLTGNTGPA